MSGRWWALTAATGCGLPSGAWRVHEMDAPCAGLAADQGFAIEGHGGSGFALLLDPAGEYRPDDAAELWCDRAHGWLHCDGTGWFDLDEIGLDASGVTESTLDAEITAGGWAMVGTVAATFDCDGADCPVIAALATGTCGPVAFEATVD